jgi:DNA primase small subunit
MAMEEGMIGNEALQALVSVGELAVQGVNEEKGESDEPVTADIKRLIRLPGSLHGKTGLRVTPVAVDALKDFDPLRDAVAFDERPARVVVSKPEKVTLGGVEYDCAPGPQELPLRYALFLTLRRRALAP